MKLKASVSLAGITPEMAVGLFICDGVYERLNFEHNEDHEMTVTSIKDGKHMEGSRHYSGNAADLRIWNIPQPLHSTLTKKLKEALGLDFDVVLESDHIHVEFDPK